VIRADKDARHGRVIAVIDALERAKLNKISFAVTPANN
jgi:biopolymer transport protein ExbD